MNANANRPSPVRVAIVLAIAAISVGALFFLQSRGAPSRVTRAEVLATAREYLEYRWIPTARNVFHGIDEEGIRVDTPDALFQPGGDERGWWLALQPNVGLPYKWGGFDTPQQFDRGLREGKYAGDIYSAEKRRLLDAAVSLRAVGVDCSGFVSRCWRLPRSYSTRELPRLCDPIRDFALLQPGDIFNRHNAHVRLFAGWADLARTRVRVYEAKARVQLNELELRPMIDAGYSAWRYRGLID
jgi:hypothetical protein